MHFLSTLKYRNRHLYYFGWYCLVAAGFSMLMSWTTSTEVLGISAWIKPFKFFLSSAIFSWSMGWYMTYLQEERKVGIYSWVVIIVLFFETTYIAIQGGRGELSHFNNSNSFYAAMFGLMGLAITVMTLWTAYIGYLFFKKKITFIPAYYLWGIRLGIIIFVIFALQGGAMARAAAHTVGAPDGGPGLPLLNWNTQFGDLRIAHFLGMHALQIIPLVSFFLLRKTSLTLVFGILYFLLATFLLIQASMGIPLLPLN